MDYIVVSNLLVFANHGVFQEEKTIGQKFYIDLKLGLDLQEPAITNDLTKSVHYGVLSNEVTELFKSKSNDLIETCAEEIALFVLKKYDIVQEINVKVKKPWAPIALPVDDVYVDITRKKHKAFLSLGSNIGDRQFLLDSAIKMIEDDYTKITNIANFYETKAWGLEDQDDFLNTAIEIETIYNPMQLLSSIQKIEIALGRQRTTHWGPRTIDIDILFYDDIKIFTPNLVIPHPYIAERTFVLEPMCDIAPFLIHPIHNKSIITLFEEIKKRK